jgi:hypothetical protein
LLKLTEHLADGNTRWLLYKGSRLPEEIASLEERGTMEIRERAQRRYLLFSRS